MRPGLLETDLAELAIIVHYEIESTFADGTTSKSAHTKKERLKTLTAATDAHELAQQVVENCKYIPSKSLMIVEQHIENLKDALERGEAGPDSAAAARKGGEEKEKRKKKKKSGDDDEEDELDARMEDIDDYIELLYEASEDLKHKIQGTAYILKLCHFVGNLEHLVQNGTLMGALSRELTENYKKSPELCYNITRMFLAFSNFVEMHAIIANYKIGALTLKVVELEVSRWEHRAEEQARKKADEDKAMAEAKAKTAGDAKSIEDVEKDFARARKRDASKQAAIQRKQDKVMFVALHVLINLAEDAAVERKMVKKALVGHLATTLEHTGSENLLVLAVMFLKKLSVFEGNKNEMRERNLVAKIVARIPSSSEQFGLAALRLLFNLSFDPAIREQMVKAGAIPKFVEMLKHPRFRGVTLRLLYHMSIDDRCKSLFTYTEAIPITMQLVIKFPQDRIARELGALAVNLSLNARNAELMCGNKGLYHLVARVERTKDPLLMKVIRNIAQWTHASQAALHDPETEYRQRGTWARHAEQLMRMALETDSHDLLVEALGTLGNFTKPDLPRGTNWARFLEELNLTSFIAKLLVPGMAQHDVVLEVVVLVGAIAADPAASPLLATSKILSELHELWRDKADDAEITLQLLYTFYQLLQHEDTREELLYSTRAIMDVLDCLSARHPEVRRVAELCLDLVLEHDRAEGGALGELGVQVRRRRFQAHNAEWLAAVSDGDAGGDVRGGGGLGGGRARIGGDVHDDSDDDDADGDLSSSMGEDGFGAGGGGGGGGGGMLGHRGERLAMDMTMLQEGSWPGSEGAGGAGAGLQGGELDMDGNWDNRWK